MTSRRRLKNRLPHRFSLLGPPVGGKVFGVLALVLLLLAAWWGIQGELRRRTWATAPGKVLAIEKRYSTDRKRRTHVSYRPRIRYSVSEKEIEITALGASRPAYREGDVVTILYPRAHPEQGMVSSFQELREGAITAGAFGLLFAGVAALLWRFRI